MGVPLVSPSSCGSTAYMSDVSLENEQLLLANMTLFAPDGLQVRFSHGRWMIYLPQGTSSQLPYLGQSRPIPNECMILTLYIYR